MLPVERPENYIIRSKNNLQVASVIMRDLKSPLQNEERRERETEREPERNRHLFFGFLYMFVYSIPDDLLPFPR